MEPKYILRKEPLKWSQWKCRESLFADQHYHQSSRARIVGYHTPKMIAMEGYHSDSFPIYEIEEHRGVYFPIRYQDEKPRYHSSFKRSFVHPTYNSNAPFICISCLNQAMGYYCVNCGIYDDMKKVFRMEYDLPSQLGLTSEFHWKQTTNVSWPFKEELMRATWNPQRKDMFKWNLDTDELQDLEPLDTTSVKND